MTASEAPAGLLHRSRVWINSSLQRRLIVALAVVLALISALFLVMVIGLYQQRITQEKARASLQINSLLQATLENAMLKRDLPGLRRVVNDLGQQADIEAVRILAPSLVVRFSSDPDAVDTVLDGPDIRAALAEQTPKSTLIADAPGGAVLRSINPVLNQPACLGCHGPVADHPVNGLLVVDYAAGSIARETRQSVLLFFAIGLSVILATSLSTWGLVTRTVISPLERLNAGTAALTAGRLDHRIPVQGKDEIASLGSSFNAMAERLQATVTQLNAAEAFLQSVIDAIPDGIRVIDSDYGIVKANAAYAAHVGLPLPEVLGTPCYRSSHRRESPCPETLVCCPLKELRDPGTPLICRQIHVGPDGEEIHVEVAAALVDVVVDGETRLCVVEAIRDLEHQARMSQEHRLSELGLLAAGMAHEIHNPLSSVELILSAMQEDVAAGQQTDLPRRLETLREEIARTLAITNSLLMLSQPPSAGAVLIDLDRVIPEALGILAFEGSRTGVEIVHDISPGLRLYGSESDLRMLITNLVINAFHAMPEGGKVTVTARAEGTEIALRVADAGIGIAPRDLDRIFLPFWTRRADGSGGRGLGLSIIKAIVERWSGRIEVTSKPGEGSTFTVFLPDPDSPAPPTPEERTA